MQVCSKTDIGLMRKSNQDYCRTGLLDDGTVWAIVCDGMGGANGGSTASRIATDTIAEQIAELYKDEKYRNDIEKLASTAIATANQRVYDISQKVYSLYGMGTTVVTVIVKDNTVHIVHAGDSRAYIYENGSVRQITKDHSMVQELVDMGQITPEQARNHPNKNIITRALGTKPNLKTDYNYYTGFSKGNVLIVCTDGLSNYMTDDSLAEFVRKYQGNDLADKLVENAKSMGGSDNITVVIIEG